MPDNLKDKIESGREKDDAYANKTNHGIPVDRGWAWVILIGMLISFAQIPVMIYKRMESGDFNSRCQYFHGWV